MLTCRQDGTPDSNGDYELVDGRPQRSRLRDGERLGFEIMLMDGSKLGDGERDPVADAYSAMVADMTGGRTAAPPQRQGARFVPDQAALADAEARCKSAYEEMVADLTRSR